MHNSNKKNILKVFVLNDIRIRTLFVFI